MIDQALLDELYALNQFPYAYDESGTLLVATLCITCGASGCESRTKRASGVWDMVSCAMCQGLGFTGLRPELPTIAPFGTCEREVVKRLRYANGFPLHHPLDTANKDTRGWRLQPDQETRLRRDTGYLIGPRVAPEPDPEEDEEQFAYLTD